jgi:hypothetical protein
VISAPPLEGKAISEGADVSICLEDMKSPEAAIQLSKAGENCKIYCRKCREGILSAGEGNITVYQHLRWIPAAINNPILSKLKQSEETDHKIEGMKPMFVEKNTTAKSRNYQTGGKSSPTWGKPCQESES